MLTVDGFSSVSGPSKKSVKRPLPLSVTALSHTVSFAPAPTFSTTARKKPMSSGFASGWTMKLTRWQSPAQLSAPRAGGGRGGGEVGGGGRGGGALGGGGSGGNPPYPFPPSSDADAGGGSGGG